MSVCVYGEYQCAAVKKMVENVYSLRLSTPAPFFSLRGYTGKMAVAAAKTRSKTLYADRLLYEHTHTHTHTHYNVYYYRMQACERM